MATIRLSQSEIVVISKENIVAFQLGGSEKRIYQSTVPKLPDPEEKRQPQGNEEGSRVVLACGFSPTGQLFISCDNFKQLTVWQVTLDGPWQRLSTRTLARRATTLTFVEDESAVLIGDKSGDVYSYSIADPEKDGDLLMGHVSMLLDMVLCSGGALLVTSDRDEKIRVSHHPNAHSIHSYCLGHTDFVSCLGYFPTEDILVSGSGDGTLRLWNYKLGDEITIAQCEGHLQQEIETLKSESTTEAEEMDFTDGSTENTDLVDKKETPIDWKKARLKAKGLQGIDLKCVRCCPKQNVIAVGFDGIPAVLLYKLDTVSSDLVSLTFFQKISLDASLWDMTFDPEGLLLVLQACPERSLVAYEHSQAENKMIPLKESASQANLVTTIQAINASWDLIKGSLDQDSIFSVLHKVKIDNATYYLEQKQKKLSEQKEKYKVKQERRNRSKQVLPPVECESNERNIQDHEVAPPSECMTDAPVADHISKKAKTLS